MCNDNIRIVKSMDNERVMIFAENKFIGAINMNELEKFIKDEKISLIDFENIKFE